MLMIVWLVKVFCLLCILLPHTREREKDVKDSEKSCEFVLRPSITPTI